MSDLAILCPCGHSANYHPTQEQQTMYLQNSGGRYAAECKYFMGIGAPCCRCITPQETVMRLGKDADA